MKREFDGCEFDIDISTMKKKYERAKKYIEKAFDLKVNVKDYKL